MFWKMHRVRSLCLIILVTSLAINTNGFPLPQPKLSPSGEEESPEDEVTFVGAQEDEYGHDGDGRMQSWESGDVCPPIPPVSSKACESDGKCEKDADCGDSFSCCFNGCIHVCLPKVDLPKAFDWIEETELKNFNSRLNRLNETLDLPEDSSQGLMKAERKAESVSLPGGCFLNFQEYEDLLLFRKYRHVLKCGCEGGEVKCEVNVGKTTIGRLSN